MYKIIYHRQALKFLENTQTRDREKIQEEIISLSNNPRKDGVIKLQGKDRCEYRTRYGMYRIIFLIHDKQLVVEVIEVFKRKDGY